MLAEFKLIEIKSNESDKFNTLLLSKKKSFKKNCNNKKMDSFDGTDFTVNDSQTNVHHFNTLFITSSIMHVPSVNEPLCFL